MPGSPRPPALPEDPAIPAAADLLDPERAAVLVRTAVPDVAIGDVRVRYLAYAPGIHLVAQLDAETPQGRIDVAVTADASGYAIARYPDDPALPLLGRPDEVARRLGLRHADARRLAWVPTERATLRFGDVVVKLYARPAAALDAYAMIGRAAGAVPTARPLGIDAEGALVAQELLPGRTLQRADALAWAQPAAELLDRLRGAELDGVPVLDAAGLLAQADAPVALVCFALPEVTERLRRCLGQLRDRLPVGGERRPAHGDFNVGQLLVEADRLAVVDVDTLCLAAPALDLAGYATNVVSGRPDDLADARRVLAELTASGAPVEDLDWYVAASLLRRVDRAVRRLKRDWTSRTVVLVEAIEATVAEW